MSDLATAIVTTLGSGALLTALLTFVITRRRYSGSVETSDAKAIFKRQEEQIAADRAFLLAELSRRDIRISGLETTIVQLQAGDRTKDMKIGALESAVAHMTAELLRKDERIVVLEADGTRKDERIAGLEQDREELRARVRELERIDSVRVEAARAIEAAHHEPQGAGL